MKYLDKYNRLITESESNWLSIAISNLKYNRDNEIVEFFQELLDLGGKLVGIKGLTHTILDSEFELKSRINYTNKPLYQVYTFRLKFDELSTSIYRSKIDDKMNKVTSFFTEFSESLNHINGFGFKFKLRNFKFDPSLFNMNDDKVITFDIQLYHTDDIVPWEYIFASPEFT